MYILCVVVLMLLNFSEMKILYGVCWKGVDSTRLIWKLPPLESNRKYLHRYKNNKVIWLSPVNFTINSRNNYCLIKDKYICS